MSNTFFQGRAKKF